MHWMEKAIADINRWNKKNKLRLEQQTFEYIYGRIDHEYNK